MTQFKKNIQKEQCSNAALRRRLMKFGNGIPWSAYLTGVIMLNSSRSSPQ
jgi:hypothetical protein